MVYLVHDIARTDPGCQVTVAAICGAGVGANSPPSANVMTLVYSYDTGDDGGDTSPNVTALASSVNVIGILIHAAIAYYFCKSHLQHQATTAC